ncbi:MAG: hypothetical protein V3T84_13100 [Phycisphaerales bacterium]
MPNETNQRLWDDPLWCALANAITKLNAEGTRTLRTWTRHSASKEQVNQMAKKAGLTNRRVINVEHQDAELGPNGWKHPDRWQIEINHPHALDPIVIHLGNFPPSQARAALPEIVNYLRAWQGSRAEQLSKQRPAKAKPAAKRHRRRKRTEPTKREMQAYKLSVEQGLSGQDLADALGIKSRSAAWRLVNEAKRLINGKKRQSVRPKARYDETEHRS